MPDATRRPSIRQANRRRTHDSIVEAATEIVRTQGHAGFTMPEVAAAAGTSLRTLYRYFPTRQDLVDALATVADQVTAGPLPAGADGLERWLAAAWENLLDEEPLMRAQHVGSGGAQVRRARVPMHREVTAALVEAERPDLSATDRDDIVDIALLVTSSTALFEFIDVLEVDPQRGARLAAMVVRVLLDDVGRSPD